MEPEPAAPVGGVEPEAERAFADVARWLDEGRRCVALLVPGGAGVRPSLRALAGRLGPQRTAVLVPNPLMGVRGIAAWVLQSLDAPPGDEPERRLAARAREAHGRGRELVVLLDEAHLLEAAPARRLGALLRDAGEGLRVVLAGRPDAAFVRCCRGVDPLAEFVVLDAPRHAAPEPESEVEEPDEASPAPPPLGRRRRRAVRVALTAALVLTAALLLLPSLRAPEVPPGDVAGPAAPQAAAPPPVGAPPPATAGPVLVVRGRAGARVEVDGAEVGHTPLVALHLTAGRHSVAVVLADGRRIEHTVELGAEPVTLEVP